MGNLKDLATGLVAVAPSPATSGTTLEVGSGEGDRYPATPFFAIAHPADQMPDPDNAEQVEVTDVTGDVLTITRAQGITTAKSIDIGWRITNAVFKSDLDAKVETLSDLGVTATSSELNVLDGITASTTELNYTDGVTSNIQTQLDSKVDENSAITGAIKTKITYDAKGLVTAGADATTADIADSTNKRYVTDAQLTVIGNTSGTNTGDQTSIVGITGTTAQFNTALSDNDFATLAGSETLTSKTLTSPVINTGISGTAFLDEDDMASNSATKVASQQSIKAYVDNKAGVNSLIRNELPSGTINGSNTAFTLASTPATGSLRLYKNGIRLKVTDDYSLSGTTITMVTAPATSTKLLADYEVTSSVYSVGTNSVIIGEVPSGTVNGSNTTFTFARAYIAGTVEVFINGVSQARTTHFTETTPASGIITMSDAPATGDIITVNYQYNLNPSSNADTVDGFHAADLMPVGAVLPFAGINVPSGNWLFCYGQAVSRTTYADLFTALSTTYGVGDGSTTFNLPDLRGRVPAGQDDMGGSSANRLTNPGSTGGMDGDTLGNTGGQEAHVQTTAELATHNHNVNFGNTAGATGTGLAYSEIDGNGNGGPFLSNTGSSTAFNVVQPTIILNYIIKAL